MRVSGEARVLMIDQSKDKRRFLKQILRDGVQVLEANDENEASDVLKRQKVDVCMVLPETYQDLAGQNMMYCAQLKTLERKASLDSLTGLLNHASAKKMIKERLRYCTEAEFAFLIFDMDDFKGANDTYGHKFGDDVLIYIAEELRSVLREEDFAVRIGGDEFLIVLEFQHDIVPVADRIFKMLGGTYQQFLISLSMGISTTRDGIRDYDVLFKQADQALYTAKRNGRGQYVFYCDQIKAPDGEEQDEITDRRI